jgi:microcystin-dependent protein
MSEPFLAQIQIVAYNFAPKGWAFCNGQLLPIAQNTALFSLLGTTYGGDGRTNFALPNLQGNAPLHVGSGQGPGLNSRVLGEAGGEDKHTLTVPEMPAHTHAFKRDDSAVATTGTPSTTTALGKPFALKTYGPPNNLVPMGTQAGGNQPHENRQPYLALNFIIALQGIFPARS